MDEASLLKAVVAEPQDKSLRLVYADALEERGDPRAEYIRLEEAARGVAPWDDLAWSTRLRRRELQATCEPDWLQSLGYAAVYRPLFTVLPTRREHRWRLLHTFVETWHDQALTPNDGNSPEEIAAAEDRLGIGLPAAVREFYAQAGKRLGFWSRQDGTYPIESLDDVSATPPLLRFRIENQGCTTWYVAIDGSDDPPVMWDNEGTIELACETFSEFTLVTLVMEGQWHGEFSGSESIVWDTVRPHVGPAARLRHCQFACRYWVLGDLRLLEGDDVLLLHADDWLFVGARTPAAYVSLPADLVELLDRNW